MSHTGGRLNIKMSSYSIGIPMLKRRRSHDLLSLAWESPYLGKTVFILTGPWSVSHMASGFCIMNRWRLVESNAPNVECNNNGPKLWSKYHICIILLNSAQCEWALGWKRVIYFTNNTRMEQKSRRRNELMSHRSSTRRLQFCYNEMITSSSSYVLAGWDVSWTAL